MHLQSSSEFMEFLKLAGKGFNHSGHVLHTASTGGVSVWALGTRGALARYPKGGTRCGLPGHVAYSENVRRVALGVGFRDTWHAPKETGGGLSVWLSGHVARSEGNPKGSLGVAFGTHGTLRRKTEGVSRCGFRDTWHAPKEIRRGFSVWLSGHVAPSEGNPK